MKRESLLDLAVRYFRRRGYLLEEDVSREGLSGVLRNVDLLVRRGREQYPVWVKDWRRTVGINVVINVDRASEDAGFSRPIIVADKFSDHAKAYANRRGVRLLTRSEIRRSLGY
ncbi:MAG: hypothetical protein AYL32_011890 [Candidatus Bathyarchaeota archaeon B26-2]|nr:MAG: hypothetical protein AYL32_011890 [Candidatus Bathyarchaeota archaeon B26-2]